MDYDEDIVNPPNVDGIMTAADPGECVPEPETCNDGLDNDCDGMIDDSDTGCQVPMQCSDYRNSVECNSDQNSTWSRWRSECRD